jgi:hypothetical protein
VILCNVGVLLHAMVERSPHCAVIFARTAALDDLRDLVLRGGIRGSDTTDAYFQLSPSNTAANGGRPIRVSLRFSVCAGETLIT